MPDLPARPNPPGTAIVTLNRQQTTLVDSAARAGVEISSGRGLRDDGLDWAPHLVGTLAAGACQAAGAAARGRPGSSVIE